MLTNEHEGAWLLGSYKIYIETTFWETNRAYTYVLKITLIVIMEWKLQNKIL